MRLKKEVLCRAAAERAGNGGLFHAIKKEAR